MSVSRKGILWKVGLPLLLAAAGVILFLAARPKPTRGAPGTDFDDDDDSSSNDHTVVFIKPTNDPAFFLSVQELATVEPFFTAELRAQVAGNVKYVQKNIKDPVAKGDLLIGIDVPHLVNEVAQKEAIIVQRQRELDLAKTLVKTARSHAWAAKKTIDWRQAMVKDAEATRDLRFSRFTRFQELRKGPSPAVDAMAVEETQRDYFSSSAFVEASEAAVQKSIAEYEEEESKLETALTDIKYKEALVDVARKDRDRVQAERSYAQIRAPWAGRVSARHVDPGTSVNIASGGQSQPIMTVIRTDVVTVVVKVPDNVARFVNEDTYADIEFDTFKGLEFHGKVTRNSPDIDPRDVTNRVEIDLFNDAHKKYEEYREECLQTHLAPLAAASPLGFAALAAASRNRWSENVKGERSAFPLYPLGGEPEDLTAKRRMTPGMTGYARLHLRDFQNPLIPSSAVFGQGGKTFILEIVDGKTKRVPVRVELNDGTKALVAKLVRKSDEAGAKEGVEYLTGKEEIVLNRQLEIGDGQEVTNKKESTDWLDQEP